MRLSTRILIGLLVRVLSVDKSWSDVLYTCVNVVEYAS